VKGEYVEILYRFGVSVIVKGTAQRRRTIVQPLVQGSRFPDGIQVHADGVGTWDDGSGNNVVSVEQRSSNGLSNSVDVD